MCKSVGVNMSKVDRQKQSKKVVVHRNVTRTDSETHAYTTNSHNAHNANRHTVLLLTLTQST